MGHDEFGLPGNFYILKKKKEKKRAILPLISKIGVLDKMSTFYTFFREFPKTNVKRSFLEVFQTIQKKFFHKKLDFSSFRKMACLYRKMTFLVPFFREFPETFMTS